MCAFLFKKNNHDDSDGPSINIGDGEPKVHGSIREDDDKVGDENTGGDGSMDTSTGDVKLPVSERCLFVKDQ